MVSLLFAGINSIFGIVYRYRKYMLVLVLVCIFVLFAWSEGVADRALYIERFYNYSSEAVRAEAGYIYSSLRKVFNALGISFNGWMVFNAIVYCGSVGFICYKFSENNAAFPAVMMIIYPLCMDATILRQTLANCFGWIALGVFVFSEKRHMQNYIIAGGFALLSVLIHPGCLFILVFVLINVFKDDKRFFWFLAVVIPVLSVFVYVKGLDQILLLGQKIIRSHSIISIRRYSFRASIVVWFKMTIYLVMFIIQMAISWKYQGELTEFQHKVLKANFAILLLYPLIPLSNDLYRIQEMLTLFNYCAVGEGLLKSDNRYTTNKDIILIATTIVFALVNLYLLAGRANYTTVLEPFFRNNAFFKGLW